MEQLNVSGIYIRAKKDDKFGSFDVTDLTPEEMQDALGGKTPEELIRWIAALSKLLREVVQGQA